MESEISSPQRRRGRRGRRGKNSFDSSFLRVLCASAVNKSGQMANPFIEFRSITKTFGGVTALDDVSLSIARGECHGLMGENGAGKSTLGKVLAAIHRPDSGAMLLDYCGYGQQARRLEKSLAAVYDEGKILTVDQAGEATTLDFIVAVKQNL